MCDLDGKKKSFISLCHADSNLNGANCDTVDLSDAVCIESGTYANPFASFCATNATRTSNTPIADVLAGFCVNPATTFDNRCMDGVHGVAEAINTARKSLANTCVTPGGTGCGQEVAAGLTVADCSANPYRTGCDEVVFADVLITRNGICSGTGTNPFSALCASNPALKTDQDNACLTKGADAAFVGNDCESRDVVRDKCDLNPYETASLDATVPLCTGNDSNGVRYGVAQAKCEDKTTTFSETYCNPNDKNEIGGNPTAVKMARNTACAERGTAADNRCATRQNIIDTCKIADPFANKGCDTATHVMTEQLRETYCTNGDRTIFDTECNGNTYGDTDKARAVSCLRGTPIDPATNLPPATCGDASQEKTAGNFIYTYCQAQGSGDKDNCPDTYADTRTAACEETDPWGSDCNAIVYNDERKALCATGGTIPDSARMSTNMSNTQLCDAVAVITCDMGGTASGATVVPNPFDAICSGRTANYTPQRLARCEMSTATQITDLGGDCRGAGLSDVICGADASKSGTNPFAPICQVAAQNANHGNLASSKGHFCGNTRLNDETQKDNDCDVFLDTLCSAENSVKTMQGTGLYSCLGDNTTNVMNARRVLCEAPTTTYNTGCTTDHGGEVLATRKTLATSCVEGGTNFSKGGTANAVCNQRVNGAITVADCSANPYRTECTGGTLTAEFADVTTARNNLCISSTSEPTSNPFDGLCEVFTGGGRDIKEQRTTHCSTSEINPWDAKCADNNLVTAGDAGIANARANVCINNQAIVTTAGSGDTVAAGMSLFNSRCDNLSVSGGATVTQTRFPYCNGALDGLTGAGGSPALCKDTELSGAICGTGSADASVAGSNPFAPICTESSGAALLDNFDANGARTALAEACRVTNNVPTNCSATITGTSGGKSVADCTKNPYNTENAVSCFMNGAFDAERTDRTTRCTSATTSFDTLCDFVDVTENVDTTTFGAIRIARGEACATDAIVTTGETCGDEGTQNSYLAAYCSSDHSGIATNVRDCPTAYAAANATAVANVSVPAVGTGENQLLNSDGSGALSVIAAGAADDGADDPTNFIEVATGGTLLTTGTNRAGLTLTDTADGFAFANSATNKLYVGLLSGTGLGAPLRSDTPASVTWNAKLSVLFGATPAVVEADSIFTLLINYGTANTANTLAVMGDGPTVGSLGKFSIVDGKFTRNGVIYGKVAFDSASAGTLTGLIGTNGAVGIFASNSGTAYVGGFIASDSVAEAADCSDLGTPFNLTDCPDASDVRLAACGGTIDALNAAGGSLVACNTAELSGAICASTGENANPFAPICSQTTATDIIPSFDQVAVQVAFCNTNSGNSECELPAWKLHARNTDDTGRLDVLAADGVNHESNPITNYIVGTADGLELGFDQVAATSAGGTLGDISGFVIGDLKLSDLDSVDAPAGDKDGVSFAAFTNSTASSVSGSADRRYYVGLWNGTDLGAPLNSTEQGGTWKGKIALVTSSALYSTVGFDLVVEFGGTNGNTLIAENIPLTGDGNFTINGKFTSAGVIYGTTTFTIANQASNGSLTGLIGQEGAVGAFVSTSEIENDAGEYVGGFVAHTNVDCSATGTPFDIVCADGNPGKLPLCGGPIADLLAAGQSLADCKHAALSGAICGIGASDLGSNHFAPICYEVEALHMTTLMEAKQKRNITLTCSALTSSRSCALSLTGKSGGTTVFACYNNPFLIATECLTNSAFDETRTTRRNLCTTEGGTFNPFDTKCDAATATDATYLSNVETARDTFCNSNKATSGHAECGTTGRTATICTDTSPTLATNPFATLCGGNDGVTTTDAQEAACRLSSNADGSNCANTIMAFCGTIATPTSTLANLFDTGICKTDFETARSDYCNDTAGEGDALCNAGGYIATICGAGDGTNVFATLCTRANRVTFCTTGTTNIFDTRCASADGLTQTVAGTNNARREACSGNEGEPNRATDAQCANTVLHVCGSERGQLGTPFHSACLRATTGTAYIVARGEACIDGIRPSTGTCGDEDSGDYIKAYCATSAGDTNITHCPDKYAGANLVNTGDTADVATLTAKALNAEGTALLPTFIADAAATTTDGRSNFIDGGATALNLGDAVTANADIPARNLTLRDSHDGFAIASTGSEFSAKYYVGILSNTDLGAPLAVEDRTAEWTGKLSITGTSIDGDDEGGVYDITLNVDLEDKELSLKDGSLNIENNFFELLTLDINGNFTANGVIYGTVVIEDEFGDTDRNNASLTGLIGVDGAVGIFKSNRDSDTTYVGGFVAEPDAADCSATGTPFASDCTNNVAEQKKFVNGCFDGSIGTGCDQPITGVAGGLTIAACIATPYNSECGGREGAFADVRNDLDVVCAYQIGTNPFDSRCEGHPSQNVNQQNFCGDTRLADGSQKQTDCDMLLTDLCAGPNSILTSVGAGNYNCSKHAEVSNDREVACGTEAPVGGSVCETIVAGLCTGADAFATTVGAGNYPCSGDLAFEGARDSYCRTASNGDGLCTDRIARLCLAGNSPFSAICGADDGVMNAEARAEACALSSDPAALSNNCGDEDTGYIANYCATAAGDTNAAYCPNKYAGAVGDTNTNLVNVSDLTDKALNADGTGLERVIANGRANPATDDGANFIEGLRGGLNLGTSKESARTFLLGRDTGFSVARATNARADSNASKQQYYYVGLLSLTNLGAPLRSEDTVTTLEWAAKLNTLTGVALLEEQEFTLLVELSGKTISGSARGIFGFDIDGNFTDTGLIYGRFVSNFGGAGTLSGLIGQRGAVGIFKSNPGSASYVGGFIADASALDCTVNGTPFNVRCTGNNDLRAQLCNNHGINPVADFNANCLDNRVTALICASSGANANPFNDVICTGDQETAQTALLNNCRADNAAGSITTTANGANCSRYTDCVANPYRAVCDATYYVAERQTYVTLLDSCRNGTTTGEACSTYTNCVANPYMDGCDATYYDAERTIYTVRLLTYCSTDSTGVTAPVGAPDCATPEIQADVCASSGTYANPLDAETCPVGYANLDMIQNEFTTTCYNARADLSERPECNNIATCFTAGNLATPATSTDGRFACNIAGLFDVKELIICSSYVYGDPLPEDCKQATITKACNANPFSTSTDGIDCISDRTRDDARNELCFGAESVQYDCTLTVSRACDADPNGKYCTVDVAGCIADPFGNSCYEGDTYNNARIAACNDTTANPTILTEIADTSVSTLDKSPLARNCLHAIEHVCGYDEDEQFTNAFCKIGSLYDDDRGRVCLYGYTPENPGDAIVIPNQCAGNPHYIAAYCTDNPFDAHATCTDAAYNAARGRECVAGYTGTDGMPPALCGDEDMADSYVKAYCESSAGDTDITNCPDNYATANTAVTDVLASDLRGSALNAEGTAPLARIILEGKANEDTDTGSNFIVGGESDLSLGADAGTITNITDDRNLTLVGDDTSGFAVASAGDNYYVGLLSGTDLGAPLTDAAQATWAGQLSITTSEGGGVYTISLNVNFNKKNLNFSQVALGLTDALTKFVVTGKFTDNGVIYGTVLFENNIVDQGREDNEGTLTGLIGANGAVGIFASNADADNTYVGGFIASGVDCSTGGTPFATNCGGTTAKLPLCSGALGALMAAGGTPALCNDIDLSGAICGRLDGGTPVAGTNPFAPICDDATAWVAGFTEANLNTIRNPLAENCGSSAQEATTPCTQSITGVAGGVTVAACSKNPFLMTDNCYMHKGFMAEQVARINTCNTAMTSFNEECDIESVTGTEATFATNTRIARGEACVTGLANGETCGDDVTAGSYILAYCTNASTAAQNNARDCGNTAYATANPAVSPVVATGFTDKILNAEGTAKLAGVITAGNSADTDATANFIAGGANALALGGTEDVNHAYSLTANDDGISGFAIASTTFTSGEQLYVGLLANTNLGGSLTATINWPAKLRVLRNGQDLAELQTFTLRADFASKTISVSRAPETGTEFQINGHFASNGLIYGNLIFNAGSRGAGEFLTENQATLTGLIGAEGAVGIFSRDAGTDSFVGGFVAAHALANTDDNAALVTDNDWTRSFNWGEMNAGQILLAGDGVPDNASASGTNRADYIQGSATGIDGIYSTAGTVNLEVLTLSAGNGAAFGVVGTGSDTALHFAGLLSGTDVGAPITNNLGSVVWTGKIGGFVNGESVANNSDFHISVFYNGAGGTIKNSNSAGSSQGTSSPVMLGLRHFAFTGEILPGGVLKGTVESSTVSDFSINTQDGTFNGIFGANGLLAVFKSDVDNTNSAFQYAGAFAAVPSGTTAPTLAKLNIPAPVIITEDDDPNLVTYTDWVLAQDNPSLTANTVSPRNQFLGTNVGDTALAGSGIVQDVAKAGGNLVIDGATVGGFSVFTNGTQFYAGILYGTDLGAPIIDTETTVTWSGSFRSIGGYDRGITPIGGRVDRETNFELEITLGRAGEDGSIAAFVPATSNSFYRIDGTFGANGYITGNVNFGSFNNNDRNDPLDGRANNGVLTGLIGQKGAIGVFISNAVPDNEPSMGEHNFTFAGGFAVAPAAETSGPDEETEVTTYTFAETVAAYSNWEDSFTSGANIGDTLQDSGVTALDIASFEGNYIKLDVSGDIVINKVINKENTLNTLTTTTVRLNENSGEDGYESGFAYAFDSDSFQRFAGLLPTTDVGGAITAGPAKVTWSGSLKGTAAAPLSSDDFKLEVGFTGSGGTIKSLQADGTTGFAPVSGVPRREGIRFVGTFNEAGVMSGQTLFGFRGGSGTFNGLIGAKGAVGVFRGEDGLGDSFAGGFVAKPPAVEATTYTYHATDAATYSDWTASFASGGVNVGETLQDSGVATSGNESADYITLNGDNAIFIDGATIATETLLLTDTSRSEESGVVFGVNSSGKSFVGLLPTTDVGGAIISGPAKAIWRGSLKGSSNAGFTSLSSDSFNLEVAFTGSGGTIKSLFDAAATDPGPAFVNGAPNGAMNFVGDFNEAGVMWGTVATGFNPAPNGVFSGLIGQNGAVGAFKGVDSDPDISSGYAGGFVVKPPSN